MKPFILIVILIAAGFFGYSSIKKEPDESICAAAYDYYDGDILIRLQYEEIATSAYTKISERRNDKNPTRMAKMTLMLQKSKYNSKNELMKLSDFISCYADTRDLAPRIEEVRKAKKIVKVNSNL
jgi:predicted negative regulator of RcsB-dependent stress response